MAKTPEKPPHLKVVPDTDKKRHGKSLSGEVIEPTRTRPLPGPAHQPTNQTRALVSICKAAGYTDEQIAKTVEVSLNTLKKYYAEELATGGLKANAKVAANLFSIATSASHPRAVTAAIWWSKARMGWTDNTLGDEEECDEEITVRISIGAAKGGS